MIRTTRYRRTPARPGDATLAAPRKKRTRKKPRQLEAPEQRALARWLNERGICWVHVPNGGARNLFVAAELKRQGVKRGYPDVTIYDAPPNLPGKVGTVLELKPPRSVDPYAEPTDEQIQWLALLRERNWLALVAYGVADATRQLSDAGYDRLWCVS